VGELTLSAFPRTGTMFFRQIFQSAFPSVKLLDGLHRIKSLQTDGQKVMTLREPCDAVSSWIVYSYPRSVVIDDALDWYCQFVEESLLASAKIIVAGFNHFTSQPNDAMKLIGQRIGIQPMHLDLTELNLRMRDQLPRNYPSSDTHRKNDYSLAVLSSCNYRKASEMYEQALLL
jgi:hypothetical protein